MVPNYQGVMIISNEEAKIREELEDDIERDLEAEIKDQICQLALRLHRLYQHQRERILRELLKSGDQLSSKDNLFSEMNIRIKMEGGSKIEISETKKVMNTASESKSTNKAPQSSNNKSTCSEIVHKHGKVTDQTGKEFNWVKTLRSEKSASNKKNEPTSTRSTKFSNCVPDDVSSHDAEHVTRKNNVRGVPTRQQNGEAYAEEMKKSLELVWKS
ncbi:hypothetical protein Scep_020405 [Stephania cephalantha]|uniref:Uncharacterized protein n=1 Tax=Stephania cephalantha TaxID=152367 RepID=A0AAP0NQS7_9MAGN